MSFVPRELAEEQARFARFAGSCLLCTTVDAEEDAGYRVVYADDRVVVVCPFWSAIPYEMLVIPRAHTPAPLPQPHRGPGLGRPGPADCLGQLREQVGDVAYNLVFHSAPYRVNEPFHWHVHVWPKVTTRAGFELGTGVAINIVAPEQAAEELGVAVPGGRLSPARRGGRLSAEEGRRPPRPAELRSTVLGLPDRLGERDPDDPAGLQGHHRRRRRRRGRPPPPPPRSGWPAPGRRRSACRPAGCGRAWSTRASKPVRRSISLGQPVADPAQAGVAERVDRLGRAWPPAADSASGPGRPAAPPRTRPRSRRTGPARGGGASRAHTSSRSKGTSGTRISAAPPAMPA